MYVEGSGLAIGVVVPHDMALDRELWRWTPDDVTLLFTRTPYSPLEVTAELVTDLSDPEMIGRAATDLVTVEPLAYAYGCTSGSFIRGEAGQQAILDAITTTTGRPSVTTSGALVRAIRQLGLRRVAVANPYADDISVAFEHYLHEVGLEVAGSRNLGMMHDIWRVDYATTRQLLLAADRDDADGIVVCCTNLASYDLIAELEAELGKPVITANQATMWAALRLVGRQAVGPGQRLIESGSSIPAPPRGPGRATPEMLTAEPMRSLH
ncbi:maleate cis-trans isomerase family protein [Microlunatus soli]|uniref:Maleate isomerase n=1 Tax=Microlunatus soli TaxID=630515 RepID=A0A1H1ZJM4_9ACTN|nr:aspartate/glutamate racemase family protein [Microlunatus soli]SDT33853.1 maleate isomerase [Microlunatus soli]